MTLEEVTSDQFDSIFPQPYHIFACGKFNQLNAARAEQVLYLVFRDTRPRLGLMAGVRKGELISPFSAPFGGFVFLDADVKLQALEEAVDELVKWAIARHLRALRITPPPPIYQESFLAKVHNVFFRKQFSQQTLELNYHFELAKFSEKYQELIWRNARKNLNQALANGLTFTRCESIEEKSLAYDVIRINRTVRGVPLRLSWQQVMETTAIIPADFFLVHTATRQPIAAAIVFRVAPGIGQIVYWGDNPEYSALKTMNYLSFKVFEHYKREGFRYLDIGYSTVDSVPNYGLCEFKESLGCDIQPKMTFVKELNSALDK